MPNKVRSTEPRLLILAALVLAYFLCYPGDLAILQQCLAVTQAFPFGFYLLIAVCVACKTATYLWASPTHRSDDRIERNRSVP